MNARDELVKVIYTSHRGNTQVDLIDNRRLQGSQLAWARLAADALVASGWQKPRSITTVEELDALPFEAVVRDAEGHVLERWGDADEVLWTTVMVNAFIPRDAIALPAAVLYEPTTAP